MIQSVHRISQILHLFRNATSLSLAQIAEQTGLAKTTVHGLVSSLREEGFLEQDPDTKRYSLGLSVFELASYYHARKDLRAIAIPFINDLARRLGMTIQLAILDKHEVVYLYKMTTADFLTFSISAGLRMPFHCTATGKAIAAFSSEDEKRHLLSYPLTPKTPFSLASSETLEAVLRKVREHGYALDLGESEVGLGGLAVPLFDERHEVVGALGVSFLSDLYTEAFLKNILLPLQESASLISRKLGCPPHHLFTYYSVL
ncbi:MAG: IclR family transcriptional regulator [Lachnospiraceae bacterium]|nr:IclR family transcriptional regulator [Lachnospiraceae bacterium]